MYFKRDSKDFQMFYFLGAIFYSPITHEQFKMHQMASLLF